MKASKTAVKPKVLSKPGILANPEPNRPHPPLLVPPSYRFRYIDYDDISKESQRQFRELFVKIEAHAEANLRESRAKSLLMTYLEVAYLWTGKAIRDEQMARQGKSVEQDQRSAD